MTRRLSVSVASIGGRETRSSEPGHDDECMERVDQLLAAQGIHGPDSGRDREAMRAPKLTENQNRRTSPTVMKTTTAWRISL